MISMIPSIDQLRYAERIIEKKIKNKKDFFKQEFEIKIKKELNNPNAIFVAGSREEILLKIKEFELLIEFLQNEKFIRLEKSEYEKLRNPYFYLDGKYTQHAQLETFLNKKDDKYNIVLREPKEFKKAIKRKFRSKVEQAELFQKRAYFALTIVAIIVSVLSLIMQIIFNNRALNRIQEVEIKTPIVIKKELDSLLSNETINRNIDTSKISDSQQKTK